MGRGDHSKNNKKKKKWGAKMEELATMVERAQLEKIEFNKRSKRKLSKKDYVAALQHEVQGADGTPTGRTNQDRRRSEEKGRNGEYGRGRDEESPYRSHKGISNNNGKGQNRYTSTSCPDSTPGFFSSNKGRSISFTGGPNFSYSQFNYTYSYEDNCGQAQHSSTTTTSIMTATSTISTTKTIQHAASLPASPIYSTAILVNVDEDLVSSSSESYESDSSQSLGGEDVNEGEDDDGGGDDTGQSYLMRASYAQGTRLRFEDDEVDQVYSPYESDQEGQEGEREYSSQESSQDSCEGESNDDANSYVPVTTFRFSHPDGEFPESIFFGLDDQQDSDSDDLQTTFGRGKRQKQLEREQKLRLSLQGEQEDIMPDYPHVGPYSTPQSTQQRGHEREGPHSWPKKSHMLSSIQQKSRDGEPRKGSDFRKTHKSRDKKKVQLKSKYVKHYVTALGTPTSARGWIEGGTVKDDDLLHKFANISEPIDVHIPENVNTRENSEKNPSEVKSGMADNKPPEWFDAVSVLASFGAPVTSSCDGATVTTTTVSHLTGKGEARDYVDQQCLPDTYRDIDEQQQASLMTPKEQQVYEAILAGNFRGLEAGKVKKEKPKKKGKSTRYPSFDALELARLMEECNDFVQNSHSKSMSLYPMTKEQRIQVYSLATLYNFKKESVGKGGNRSPVLLKSKKTAIPHCKVLGQFIRDCIETPGTLKALYLDLDEHGAPPRGVLLAAQLTREGEMDKEKDGLGLGRERARFVGENANPVGMDNIGNRMLRGMGWSGGGLGAKGEGITEPIAQKIKFSRSGLG